MTSTESLITRLHDRSRDYPHEFSAWELDRIEEWYDDVFDGETLSEKQVAILNRIDVRTS